MKIQKLQQGNNIKYKYIDVEVHPDLIKEWDKKNNSFTLTDGRKGIWNEEMLTYVIEPLSKDLLNALFIKNTMSKIPYEKPLKLVFPEFALLTGGRGLFNMSKAGVMPSAESIGTKINNTLNLTNPSTFIKGMGSVGGYTTPLGTTGASLSGALADTSLASLGLYNIGKLFYDNPNIASGAETVLAISPLGLVGNKFRYFPRAFKVGRDLYNKGRAFDGALKTKRTLSALYNVLKSPKYVDALYEYPYVLKQTPLYEFKNYSGKQMYKYGEDTARELAKGEIFPNSLHVRYLSPNTPSKELVKGFKYARMSNNLAKLAEKYGNYISNIYWKQYNELSLDPVWKSIIDESPQYMGRIYNYVHSNSTKSKEDFVKSLIERSNSYRRFMREPHTSDEFKTFNGHSITSREHTIDVEGYNRSDFNGEYGSYPAYYQGQPIIQGPIETWWSQRVPKGVKVSPGLHRYEKPFYKFRNKYYKYDDTSLSDVLDVEEELNKALINNKVPVNYYSAPTHLVFEGDKGTMLPNFKVTVDKMPEDFKWGLGYKNGGKLNSNYENIKIIARK